MVQNVWHDITGIIGGAMQVITGTIHAFIGMIGGAISAIEQFLGLKPQANAASTSQPAVSAQQARKGTPPEPTSPSASKSTTTPKSAAKTTKKANVPLLGVGGIVMEPTLALVARRARRRCYRSRTTPSGAAPCCSFRRAAALRSSRNSRTSRSGRCSSG